MHLIVPFAHTLSAALNAALAELALPNLARLLGRWAVLSRDAGGGAEEPELTLNTPHERALAAALGLPPVADGLLPMAALAAAGDGIATTSQAWGLLQPAHWALGTDQVSLVDPAALQLDVAEARAFFDAIAALFTSEGFALHFAAPTRWYLAHPMLAALPSASPDRVIGRNIDRWLAGGPGGAASPAARTLRRLQNEVQMLLYTHPLNAQREARGQQTVNSVWLSGCGQTPALQWPTGLVVDDRLRAAALADDAFAWSRAFGQLDDGPLAQLLTSTSIDDRLTLCGERHALTLAPAAATAQRGWWPRLKLRWAPPPPRRLLETL